MMSTDVEDHMLLLLEQENAGPMTFTLIFPTPRYLKYNDHVVYARFKTALLQLEKATHGFVVGSQHEQRDARVVGATHDTTVVVLQNAPAARTTPPAVFDELHRALPLAFAKGLSGPGPSRA